MDEPFNPYQPPKAELVETVGDNRFVPAHRGRRLAAVLIDGLAVAPLEFLVRLLPGMPPFLVTEEPPDSSHPLNSMLTELISFAIFAVVNYTFLKQGQTVGKKLLGLQIQHRETGALLPVQHLLLLRTLPLYLVAGMMITEPLTLLALAVILADTLCIFRSGRNTLHDDLANTRVARVTGRAAGH